MNIIFYNVIVQIIGMIGAALYFISFQFKNNKTLFRVQLLSYLFYTVHLILLGAVTGGISYIINCFRSYCLSSKYDILKSNKFCYIICGMQILALIFTYDSWVSILPVAANIASTIGGYTYNGKKIRIAGMFINSPLWIIYDIIVGSFAGIVDEVLSEASMIISVIRYGWKNLDNSEEDNNRRLTEN